MLLLWAILAVAVVILTIGFEAFAWYRSWFRDLWFFRNQIRNTKSEGLKATLRKQLEKRRGEWFKPSIEALAAFVIGQALVAAVFLFLTFSGPWGK